MKKYKNRTYGTILILLMIVGVFSACKEEEPELQLPYMFRPINFNVELNKTVATFSWAKVDSAVSYTLQLSNDSLDYSKPLLDVTTSGLSLVKELAGDTKFYARIRANAADAAKSSKFNTALSFKTPKENLFQGYGTSINTGVVYSAYMTDFNALTVKWTPAANVTHLILTNENATAKDSVLISAAEALAGSKVVSSLSNSVWKVRIFNNSILRGTTYGTVEGDILVRAGEDLQAALNSAADGQVIVLEGGAVYNVGSGTYRFNKSVKLRGTLTSTLPVVCMTVGTGTPPSATSSMLGFVDGSSMQSVKFENIDFTGYVDNNTAATKIGYLFNNNTMTTVSKLSFANCNMHNFGNTPMRIQGAKNQVIDSLSINGCKINDIGFSSTYAIVNSNSADLINAIEIMNSTIYNFKGSLILRTGQTLKSVKVINCNIDHGMQDAGSARYLMDFNNASFTGGGVTISNCVFGQTGAAMGANGIRYVAGTSVSIKGSYFTTDYVDDPIPAGATSTSIKPNMTSYKSASAALWTDPVNGNFKLLDTSFAGKGVAGDLRW